MNDHPRHLLEAVRLAQKNRDGGGRPFGAVLARGSELIATGVNRILASHDPTTHAELEAVRAASQRLKSPDLRGCTVYASGHPCPMCLSLLVMTGVEAAYYAFDNGDAAPFGFSSEATYQKLRLSLDPPPMPLTKLDVGVKPAEVYGPAN